MTITAAGKHTHKALRAHEATEPRKRRGLHVPAWLRRRTTADAIADALSQPLPAPVAEEFHGAAFEDTAPWTDAALPAAPEVTREEGPDPAALTDADPGHAIGVTGCVPHFVPDPEGTGPEPGLWLRMLDTMRRPMDTTVLLAGGPLVRVAPLDDGGCVGAVNLGECSWGSVEIAGPGAALRMAADALRAAADAADRAAGHIAAGAGDLVPADEEVGPGPEPITEEDSPAEAAAVADEPAGNEAPAAEAATPAEDEPALAAEPETAEPAAAEAPEAAAEPLTEETAPAEPAVDAEAAA